MLEDRQERVDDLFSQYLPEREAKREAARPSQPVDLDDRELLERAMRARNGSDFDALWNGQWDGRHPSQSEADLDLCGKLAFWTGRDPVRIDRLFRDSGLMRDKWERDDYRGRTIDEAIAGCREVYEPAGASVEFASAEEVDPGEIDAYFASLNGHSSGLTRASESVESVSDFLGSEEVTDSLTPTLRVSESESLHTHADGTDSDPESVNPRVRPFALPIEEFVALDRPSAEPLLADADGRATVGRNSLTLLGASGGHGKTTFDLDLFLHMAAGVDYPPWTVPRPVSILIVENEGPEELFAQKLEQRLATFPHELKARLAVCTFDWGSFSLALEEHRERLFEELAAHPYDLVFGDPLDSLGIEGVGSPAETRAFLKLMKQTGLHKSVAWWLNVHPRKEKTSDELDEIAGAWGGKPDSVFLLRRLAGDRMQLRQSKLRWAKRGRGPTLLFDFDADEERFTYLGEERDEERDYHAEVKAFLGDGKWRTAKQISVTKTPKTEGMPPGIGANVDIVKAVLEEHPDEFESRTGDAAKALGRSAKATVWQLRTAENDEPDPFGLEPGAGEVMF